MKTPLRYFAVIVCALFAETAANPQNPQVTATRLWLENQTNGGPDQAAIEVAARRANEEQRRVLRNRWQDFALKANACAQRLGTDAPDRQACARAAKAWQRLLESQAWPVDYNQRPTKENKP
jgi:sRNA-binding protein